MSIEEYLATIKVLIVSNPRIMQWYIRREESLTDAGLFRYRVVWEDESLLEIFERFELIRGSTRVTKY